MRRIELSMNENIKYEAIKKLVETNGNKRRCAIKLNCSLRTVQRLVKAYKEKGKDAFAHKNRGVPSKFKTPDNIKSLIIELFKKYNEGSMILSVKHLKDLLAENYEIKISTTTIHTILKENYLISKCATKKNKRQLKEMLKNKIKDNSNSEERKEIKKKVEELERFETHPTRPRVKYAGELIQMDASSYEWFGGIKTHLHVAIDDSTKMIVGAYFDTEETLNGYYNVFNQILKEYGIPHKFLTDKRTVFEYKRKDSPIDKEYMTNFSYACFKLGVEIETTSVAEAKGRVERLNHTLQLRIPVDFKIAGITTIEEANQFIIPYLKKLCNTFDYNIKTSESIFEKNITDEEINIYLSKVCERTIDRGNIIHFNKKKYCPINENLEKVYLKPKTKVLFLEIFNKEEIILVEDKVYNLIEIDEKEVISKEFDLDRQEKPKKERKIYRPPANHPWKQASYQAYLNKLESKKGEKTLLKKQG